MAGAVGESGRPPKRARPSTAPASGSPDLSLELGRSLFQAREKSGDVAFEVGGEGGSQTLWVHACVLQQRSKVWEAELRKGGFQESSSRRIRIEDVDPDVFLTFLEMLYTATLSLPTEGGVGRAAEVALLADRYGTAGFAQVVVSALSPLLVWGKIDCRLFSVAYRLPESSEYSLPLLQAIMSKVPLSPFELLDAGIDLEHLTSLEKDIDRQRRSQLVESFDQQLALLEDESDPRLRHYLKLTVATMCQGSSLAVMVACPLAGRKIPNVVFYLLHVFQTQLDITSKTRDMLR